MRATSLHRSMRIFRPLKEMAVMKHISAVLCICLSLFFTFQTTASATDITINGNIRFKCNLRSTYMEKHGYHFIKEVSFMNAMKTNVFAAHDADVVIKNKYDAVLGVVKTDTAGNFTVSVPKDNNYKIIVQFHGQEFQEVIDYMDTEHFIGDLGYFETEQVGAWIESAMNKNTLSTKKIQ